SRALPARGMEAGRGATERRAAAARRGRARHDDLSSCCTCRMGRDTLAVVDDRLRVHGIDALRVIDASIMPRITSGNTNAPTVMIAERGASFILNPQG